MICNFLQRRSLVNLVVSNCRVSSSLRVVVGVALLCFFTGPQAKAQTYTTNTWQGAANGTWTTVGNWSAGSAPVSNTVARYTNATSIGAGINGNSGTGTNNTAGLLFLSNGTVTITNSSTTASAANTNSALRIFGWVEGGQTNLIVNSSTSGSLIFSNNGSATATLGVMRLQLASGGVINVANAGARVGILGPILEDSGETNTIIKTGAGALILGGSNANTWGGGVILNDGILQLNKASALGTTSGLGLTINGGTIDNGSGGALTLDNNSHTWAGNFSFLGSTNLNLGSGSVNLTGNRTVTVVSNALTVGGAITNTGGIIKSGAGTLILSGANTYNGTTLLSAGTLALNNTNALQNSILDTGSVGGHVVTFTVGGNNTYNLGGLQGSDGLAIGANSLSVGSAGGNTTYSGAISGTGGVTKTGGGNLTLSGNNSYSGNTTVSQGNLLIDSGGSIASSALTTVNSGSTLTVNGTVGNLSVASGGTLKGSGLISGSATISGSLQAGNSPGILNVSGDLTLASGGSMVWELFKNVETQENPAAFDQILVGGNLSFAGGNGITLDFGTTAGGSIVNWTDSFWDSDRSWMIYDVAGTTTGFSNLSLLNTLYNDATGASLAATANRSNATFSLSQVGTDVLLNYNAVPEPSSSMLMVLGLAGLIGIRAMRRKSS